MVAFMYLGTELYNGNNEYEMVHNTKCLISQVLFQAFPEWLLAFAYFQIRNIMKTQGQLPHSMLCCGRKTHLYFQRDKTSANSVWKLKVPF